MMLMGFIGVAEIIVILSIVLFVVLLPVIALIDIVRSEFQGNNKIVWVLVVLLFPFLGPILYFIIGTSQKVRK